MGSTVHDRANGRSYVCDVNGFSFVKNSAKYYDDCARIVGNMILRHLAPTLHIPWAPPFQLDDPPIVPTTFGKMSVSFQLHLPIHQINFKKTKQKNKKTETSITNMISEISWVK